MARTDLKMCWITPGYHPFSSCCSTVFLNGHELQSFPGIMSLDAEAGTLTCWVLGGKTLEATVCRTQLSFLQMSRCISYQFSQVFKLPSSLNLLYLGSLIIGRHLLHLRETMLQGIFSVRSLFRFS